jgi:transglutaminase-like putative cysteine protease
MIRYALAALLLLGGANLVRADEKAVPKEAAPKEAAPKIVLETWHAAYYEGAKAGHMHTLVEELKEDGVKFLRTTRALHLSIRRYNKVVPLRAEMVSDEKEDGKVLGLGFTLYLDKDAKLVTTGRVKGDKLVVKTNSSPRAVEVPWNDDCIGQYRQDRIYQDRKVKAGDSLHYLAYELTLMAPLTVRATVKPAETVDVLVTHKEDGGIRVSRAPVKMLRVETLPDKVEAGGGTIQPPGLVAWLDRDLVPVRYEWEFPGIGKVTFYQTTKEAALKEGVAPDLLPDLGLNTLVAVKALIDQPYDSKEAVYRVTVKGDPDAATTFARDARQEATNARANTFELHVKAVGADTGDKIKATDEYIKSSYFLDSDNPRIQALAARIVGKDTDPAVRARKIEKWVHDNMKPSNAIGFATAGQICRDLEGDCRQHALLTAALCRAAGIPARTAVGLIYAREPSRTAAFIFHMWTEVLIDGRWLGLDATLGKGGISACHLKVADHSWRDTHTLAPLLPVSRLLGKLSIEVVEVK